MKRMIFPMAVHLGGAWLLISCASESEFSRADQNNDQRMTTDEIKDRLVEAIFEKEDQNRDGQITSAEWSLVNPGSSTDLFAVRDTNGNKTVDLKEFQKFADSSGMFEKVMAQLDPNEDGFVSPGESEKVLAAVSD